MPPSVLQPSSSPGFLDDVVSFSKGNVAVLDAPPSALAGETVFDGSDFTFEEDFVYTQPDVCSVEDFLPGSGVVSFLSGVLVLVALLFATYVITGWS